MDCPATTLSVCNEFAVAARTPPSIVNRCSTCIAKIIKTSNALDRLVADGLIVIGGTPEAMAQSMKAEHAKFA